MQVPGRRGAMAAPFSNDVSERVDAAHRLRHRQALVVVDQQLRVVADRLAQRSHNAQVRP